MVHRPQGHEPVNWQPSRSMFKVDVTRENNLRITAVRARPREKLTVFVDRIEALIISDLLDEGQFDMDITEEGMKQALMKEPVLLEEGIRFVEQEKNLQDAGFMDLQGQDSKGNTVIVEIKRMPAGREAIIQLSRYLLKMKRRTHRPIRGILVAPKIRKGSQPLLVRLGLEFKRLLPEDCLSILKANSSTTMDRFLDKQQSES